MLKLPEEVKATIQKMWPHVKELHKGDDNNRRRGTQMIIEQVVHSHPNMGFGWKSSSPNNPPSKDAMARQFNNSLYSLDLVNGTTRELQLDGEMENITGQNFIPVNGVNHLGSDSGGNTGGGEEPEPVVDKKLLELLAGILATQNSILDTLERIVEDQKAQTEALVRATVELREQVNKGIKIKF